MKITPKIIEDILFLKKQGEHISEISLKYGISDSTVNKYSRSFIHPNRTIKILNPITADGLSCEKAEILGYLCSEGNDSNFISHFLEYDPRRKKSYLREVYREDINFSNMNKHIQDRFIFLMMAVYNYPLKAYKHGTVYIRRKEVIKDLRKYTLFGSKRWNVPKELFKPKYQKQARFFIRAYSDGDGTVDLKKKKVILDSVNSNSLSEMNQLLGTLKINTKFYIFTSRSRIVIYDVNRFSKLIGFLHPERRDKLKKIILACKIQTPLI